MRYSNLVLQNAFSRSGRAQPKHDLNKIRERLDQALEERELTPSETDALLSSSTWSRRERRILGQFQDNHSSDFQLFRIY